MSELSALHFAAFAVIFGIGAVIGWLFRADRCAREKIAVNAGWQEQFESQQAESRRIAEQNRGLMEQVNQARASERDYTRRTRELAEALRESTAKRDELQRLGKDLRGEVEAAIEQRNQLRADIRSRETKSEASAKALREKDHKIFKLSRELTSWQNRVPPLVEKYRERELELKELQYELEVARERNREIGELKSELARTRDRIAELEAVRQSEQTRIQPIDSATLTDGLDASNEQYNESFEADLSDLQDQIIHDEQPPEAGNGRYGLEFVHGRDEDGDPRGPDGMGHARPRPPGRYAITPRPCRCETTCSGSRVSAPRSNGRSTSSGSFASTRLHRSASTTSIESPPSCAVFAAASIAKTGSDRHARCTTRSWADHPPDGLRCRLSGPRARLRIRGWHSAG